MRSLGLPNKTSLCEVNALKIKNTVEFDVNLVLEVFFSITSEKFPDFYYVTKFKTVYVKGSLTKCCNYRPISLLPLISKS